MNDETDLAREPAPPALPDSPRDLEHRARAAALRGALGVHALGAAITDVEGLRTFMEHHVVCVWDFMSMLKSLQRDLTCVTVPWVPSEDAEAARLVNELVLGEESDECPGLSAGRYASHFEWYREAMSEVGADTRPIDTALDAVRTGTDPVRALAEARVPSAAVTFARRTIALLDEPLVVRAAAFLHARESLIPEMFGGLLERLGIAAGTGRGFRAYLERHREVDRDVHGPMCERLVERLFVAQPALRPRALEVAAQALGARLELWDAIARAVAGRHDTDVEPAISPA